MRPLLDAFGTRLDADAIVAGMRSFDVPAQRLFVYDDGLVLEIAGAPPGSDAVSRSVTWLRGAFSPLLRCRIVEEPGLPPGTCDLVDARQKHHQVVALAELPSPPAGFDAALDDLLARARPPADEARGARKPVPPPVDDPDLRARLEALTLAWSGALTRAGLSGGTVAWLELTAQGPALRTVGTGPGPHLLAWQRPGGPVGARPAWILAVSEHLSALKWLVAALDDPPGRLPDVPVLLDGLAWSVARRPTIAAPAGPLPIVVDPDRCTTCGLCEKMCPTGWIDDRGQPKGGDAACVLCMDCVEACPVDALRPSYSADTAMRGELPSIADGWLARLRGAPGPVEPAPFPPSWLLPKEGPVRTVLGLSLLTQQEHAAALIVDGVLVGAVEEEKLNRVRHYGWKPRRGAPFRNLGVDPTLVLEQVVPRRSVRHLLDEAGLTLDDVDRVAINGLPSRYRRALPVLDGEAQVPTLQSGRVVAVPHHLCHAASAFRLSGLDAAWILTVDGRGDRETAAMFRAEHGQIRPVATLLSLTDRSIGGVYETVTRHLGFGSHGQGSVMALAALGTPRFDLSPWLSARSWTDVSIHETGLVEAFPALARQYDDPIEAGHRDLAASAQAALEQTLLTLATTATGGTVDHLCFAGGVALNCKANDLLRTELGATSVWAQPGANDGGTAVGAAAEAWAQANGAPLAPMTTASLGPSFDDAQIEAALIRAGVRYTRVDDPSDFAAEKLAGGDVVCWFDGRLEFGPRALGARSILSDPRNADHHARVNRMKDREAWRPFGPSILAGHEAEWFTDGFDARFMLFTQWVRPDKRALVPVIVHDDGSTRPQVVHADTHPAYHRLISAFHARTGVPIVVNTSFNRRGEPIVHKPDDAIDAFAGLGADWLVIGGFAVRQGERAEPGPLPRLADDAALAALPGGRRLMLRVTTRCDLDCGHCTLRDHPRFGVDADHDDLLRQLALGRERGCDELILMRGEPVLMPEARDLVRRARRMGYRFVQLQTNARALGDANLLRAWHEAGTDALEVMLLGADAPVHDAIARADGAFRDTILAIQGAVRLGMDVLVTLPVLRRNGIHLARAISLLAKLGVRRVQLSFPRPVETRDGVPTEELLRLGPASALAGRAARHAQKLGMSVSTEGFPLCRLESWLHGTPDATEDFDRHRVVDMGMVMDGFVGVREKVRPTSPACRGCALERRCPKTWGLYLEMFGTAELRAVTG